VRRLAQVLLLIATLIVGAAAAAVIVSQTAWFKDWVRGFVVRQANQYLNGRLSIGRLDGNLFFGVELENVGLTVEGRPVVTIKDAGIDYNVLALAAGGIVIDAIRLNEPVVHVARDEDGFTLGHLVKEQRTEAGREGPGRSIALRNIGISNGTFIVEDGAVGTSGVDVPARFDKVDAMVGFAYEPVHYTVDIGHLSFRSDAPVVGLNALSGRVALRNDTVFVDKLSVRTEESSVRIDGAIEHYRQNPVLNLTITSDKLTLDEIARLVPSLRGIGLQPAFRVTTHGPAGNLAVTLDVRSSAGEVSGNLAADVVGPQRRVDGTVHLRHLDLAPILKRPAFATDLTGVGRVQLAFAPGRAGTEIRGTYNVEAERAVALGYDARNVKARGRLEGQRVFVEARANAYGAHATTVGTINWGPARRGAAGLSYDLSGTVAGADLRNLPATVPVPRVPSRLTLESYHLAGSANEIRAEARLAASTLAGATLSAGTIGRFSRAGGVISYAAEGAVSDLDVQRIGEAFKIRALATPRYASRINGQFAVKGSGTSIDTLRLDAAGSLADSRVMGATVPAMAFETRLVERTLDVKVNGQFAHLDPSVVTGSLRLEGDLSGSADARVTIAGLGQPLSLDDASFAGRVQLGPSTMARLPLESATIDGTYSGRVSDVRQLTVSGPTVKADAAGRLDLTDGGASDLRFRVEATDLAKLQPVTGQQASGSATVEGRATGNASNLVAAGTLSARRLAYGAVDVLSVTGKYRVELPELRVEEAVANADVQATFVKVAGQQLNEVSAKTTYARETLGFDATVRQPQRSLDAAGTLLLHPDHREVHLTGLTLRTQGVVWQAAPGSEARLEYGEDRIAVNGFRLISGAQELSAEGTIGRDASSLAATIRNVDLAGVDRLLLGPGRFGGRLEAQARATGPRDALRVSGSFSVADGAFGTFKYQSLAGQVEYAPARLALDVRLQQTPEAWIAAKGSLPAALFTGTSATVAPEPVNVSVESSPVDLAIVQGFTDQVRNVQGTLQANVKVTGDAADPHLDGGVEIRAGRFTVVPTGSTYTTPDARITLQTDRIVVPGLQIVDSEGDAMTISGSLGVHRRQLGELNLAIAGKSFEVIDNELGEMDIQPDLKVSGELRAPSVSGQVEVNKGQLNIDRILALVGSSAYSTTPTQGMGVAVQQARQAEGGREPGAAPDVQRRAQAIGAQTGGQAAGAGARPATRAGGVFDAATLALRLTMPNNFLVKGQDLRVGQSPIGLGAVNITLGGDLQLERRPGSGFVLLGSVNTIRGTYDFQGRRFDLIRGGYVRFEGVEPINPALDISARRVISGVETLVEVRGTLHAPELILSSTPPLDQADILSLIVFGQPANELGAGEQVSLAQRAGALATGFVASKLAQSIGRALDLDMFEIKPTLEPGGEGAVVTLGEQLGQRLYVKLQQGVGGANTSRFVVDYELAPFLRVESTVAQGTSGTRTLMRRVERSGVDLIFFFSY
jgi:hypothetical protein